MSARDAIAPMAVMPPRWAQRCSAAGAFLVPALALAAPSGYSWGAALILGAALLSAPRWLAGRPRASTLALALCFLGMAAVWLLDIDVSLGWGALDRPLKFLLALPCLLFLAWCAPPPRALGAGVLVGAIGAGLTGLAQWHGCRADFVAGGLFSTERCWVVTQWERVPGYTNAIQFGDLALLLALLCLVLLWAYWPRASVRWRLAWALAAALGFEASLLSMARGGWLAFALILPFAAYVATCWASRRAMLLGGITALLLAAGLVGLKGDEIARRTQMAWQEVQQYRLQGQTETSVGHRMAHWSLAWDLARERPWTGWTQAGYEAEKARRVAAGLAPVVVLRFGHAHNEVLDMLAKHGLLGLAALLALYLVPLVLFFPTRRRVSRSLDTDLFPDRTALALRVAGSLLPLAYLGFGLTQVFFAHNSGVMFYLFMVALLHAALLAHEGARNRRFAPD